MIYIERHWKLLDMWGTDVFLLLEFPKFWLIFINHFEDNRMSMLREYAIEGSIFTLQQSI